MPAASTAERPKVGMPPVRPSGERIAQECRQAGGLPFTAQVRQPRGRRDQARIGRIVFGRLVARGAASRGVQGLAMFGLRRLTRRSGRSIGRTTQIRGQDAGRQTVGRRVGEQPGHPRLGIDGARVQKPGEDPRTLHALAELIQPRARQFGFGWQPASQASDQRLGAGMTTETSMRLGEHGSAIGQAHPQRTGFCDPGWFVPEMPGFDGLVGKMPAAPPELEGRCSTAFEGRDREWAKPGCQLDRLSERDGLPGERDLQFVERRVLSGEDIFGTKRDCEQAGPRDARRAGRRGRGEQTRHRFDPLNDDCWSAGSR